MGKLFQKALALLLALSLCWSAAPALAAEVSAAASAVQLSRTEGTVAVTNSGGKALTQLADMRLYNGNHVATEAESYAWITLDSTKLHKLDAVSEMELRKNNKKLEVLLNKGNLFFNVTKPLEDQETLNIRTSTMVMGIRGTCGWVKVVDQYNTLVYVLEGTVWCTVTDPISGQSKTTALSGGESARFTVYDQERDGERCDIVPEKFIEADIDGFVLKELVGDGPMCEKIYQDSGLDLRDLTEEQAQERLERDQAETAEKLREQEELAESQDRNVSRDPVWTETDPVPEDRDSGGGTAPGTGPASDIVRLTMPVTDMEVQQALNRPGVRQVIVSPGADPARNTLEIGINMDVAPGKTLTLERGVPAQVRGGLNVDGTTDLRDSLDNAAGTVTVNSANTLRVGRDLINRSTLRVTASGRTVVEGTLSNTGSMTLTQGARVLAKRFELTAGVPEWSVSAGADAQGYYSLIYTGPAVPPGPAAVEAGDFAVTSTGTVYTYAGNVLTITGPTPVTIAMKTPGTATAADRILVADGVNADITLNGVKIDQSVTGQAAALAVELGSAGDVSITLVGDNVLKGAKDHAGLEKAGDSNSGTLTIQGNGTLEAAGGDVSGIGGGQAACHSIKISGGTVNGSIDTVSLTVTGGTVNGAVSVSSGTFVMSDGTITGDITCRSSSFTMEGGTINGALSTSADGEISLLGGELVSDKDAALSVSGGALVEIYLDGGTITSNKADGKAISWDSPVDIRFESGVVRGKNENLLSSMDGFSASQSGDGYYHLAVLVRTGAFYITGGKEGTDFRYDDLAPDGGVLRILTSTPMTIRNMDPNVPIDTDTILIDTGVSANLTLAGVNIAASAATSRPALQIADDSTGSVTITLAEGQENRLVTRSENLAGLQKNGTAGSLTIDGAGKLTASGGKSGAGIGSGYYESCQGITISGAAQVAALGGDNSPGIGSGYGSVTCTNIMVNGSCVVDAAAGNGGAAAPGIGSSTAKASTSGWTGVVYQRTGSTTEPDTVTVHGAVTLDKSVEVTSGYTLSMIDGQSLTLTGGASLVVKNGAVLNLTGGSITQDGDAPAVILADRLAANTAIGTVIRSRSPILMALEAAPDVLYEPDGYIAAKETDYYTLIR